MVWLPLQKLVAAVQFDRYNVDVPAPHINESVYVHGINYGPPPALFGEPMLIPRIWNMGLGSLQGLRQFGFGDSNSALPLPPPPIYPPRRGDLRSLSLSWGVQTPRSADTMYVPSTFIGWNPNNGVTR